MGSEVFRFMTVRPPQRVNHQEIEPKIVRTYGFREREGKFFKTLRKAIQANEQVDRSVDKRTQIVKIARDYLDSSEFVSDLGKDTKSLTDSIQAPLSKLDRWLNSQKQPVKIDELLQAIQLIFGSNVEELIAGNTDYDYEGDRRKVADSLIVASIIDSQKTFQARPKLMRAMRLFGLLERIAANDETLQKEGAVERALRATVLLPPDIFPLPPARSSDRDNWLKSQKKKQKKRKKQLQHKLELAERLQKLENARDEISRVFATDVIGTKQENISTNEVQPATVTEIGRDEESQGDIIIARRSPANSAQIRAEEPNINREITVTSTDSYQSQNFSVSSAKTIEELSADTLSILTQRGTTANDNDINVPEVLDTIETEIEQVASELYVAQPSHQLVKLGNTYLPMDGSSLPSDFFVEDLPQLEQFCFNRKVPGLCPVTLPETTEETLPDLPAVPHSIGLVRPIGITDLLIVTQEIQRYEAGEIAHIENVLQGEFKERTHRRTRTTEESFFQETERTEESERDLESTERFELQQEAQQVISEETSKEAGVTVTAKYGTVAGSIEATANASYASDVAKEESKRVATAYARDVTDRSVSRLQERVLERRFRRTVEEIEEVNTHGIDNKGGSDHIIGIYRWVDKIYKAQTFNYGKRMMFEFMIPEPAAFFRHAELASPIEGITLEKPDPPRFCSIDSCTGFSQNVPLSPAEITPENYLFWVSKYNVTDVETPPPQFQLIGTVFDEEFSQIQIFPDDKSEPLIIKASTNIEIPDGYEATKAWVRPTGRFEGAWVVEVVLGRKKLTLRSNQSKNDIILRGNGNLIPGETGIIPIALYARNVMVLAATVEILCERTQAALDKWKFQTYNSIMIAYNEQKAQYEEQLAAAEIQEGIAIRGRNPLKNREIERTELKKNAISILTGQHFDLFDAMRQAASPQGYPQVDFEEAEAEGRYIQFFEQAFEWENMTYLFYPYFWGCKQEWTTTSLLDDEDPLFGKFLRAGAARVQVPVRPEYKEVILFFIESGGCIWSGGEPPHVEDELYVSIVNEIKEEQNAVLTQGKGVISVTKDSPVVEGIGTEFNVDDIDREIVILGDKYRIADVESETSLTLTENCHSSTQESVRYALGVKFVGEPWEMKIPTSLVILQQDSALPHFL